MAEISKPATVWYVHVYEYERGWGQKLLTTKWFDTHESARLYVEEIVSKNNLPQAPDCYITAEGPYKH